MGTRHLIAVQIDGQYKIAQYGQFDGYPERQGVTVLEFLKSMDRPVFEAKLRSATWIPAGDLDRIYTDPNWKKKWPQISRELGAEILQFVANKPPGLELKNSIDFAGDSLMCEWAYVIDFDKNTFEIFKGFNQTPLDPSERFANSPTDGDYAPVKKVAEWPLDKLPEEAEMIAKANPKQDEE